jgi:hypothetical protein
MTDEPQGLPIWAIYDHPADFPDTYAARLFINDKPTAHVLASVSLDALREHFAQQGLVKLDRHPTDDPKIVETWL